MLVMVVFYSYISYLLGVRNPPMRGKHKHTHRYVYVYNVLLYECMTIISV